MKYEELSEHHAVLYVHPQRKSFTESLWKILHTNSLVHILHDHTVLDIDSARALTSWVNTPYEGGKIALVSFHTITVPAQNALLKILEEPRIGVRFILVTSNKEALIPTLYSRIEEHRVEEVKEVKNTDTAIFLATIHAERMKLSYITKILQATDEEDRKDREGVRACILSLVPYLQSDSASLRYVPIVLEMASYAEDSSSSGKALLEYLSLLLPQIK